MLETLDPRIVPALTAVTDTFTVHQGASLTNLGDVRSNDLDTNSITKGYLASGPAFGAATFTFGSYGANVAFKPVAGSIASDGTITNGFTGTTSFDYYLKAGTVTSNTVTSTITVTNTVPVAETTTLFFTTGKNQAFHIDKAGMGNVTDADFDTVGPVKADGSATNVTFTTAAGGTVYLNWITGFSYNPPDQTYEGYDSFEFCWWDKAGFSNAVTANVKVGNGGVGIGANGGSAGGPEANPDSFTTAADQALEGNVLANDTAYGSASLAATAGTFTTTLGGSVVIAADGSFTYTPPTGQLGIDGFTYGVTDSYGATATGEVSIAIGADVSGIVYFDGDSDGYLSANEGGLSGYTVQLVSVDSLGTPIAVVESVTTTAGGLFAFSSVAEGDYRLRILRPGGVPIVPAGNGVDANGYTPKFQFDGGQTVPVVMQVGDTVVGDLATEATTRNNRTLETKGTYTVVAAPAGWTPKSMRFEYIDANGLKTTKDFNLVNGKFTATITLPAGTYQIKAQPIFTDLAMKEQKGGQSTVVMSIVVP